MNGFEIVNKENAEIVGIDEDFLVNLERVDFDNPMTILSYGSSLLNEMGEIMQSIAKLMNNEEHTEMDIDINEKIRDLGNFSTSLEKVDKLTTKAKSKGVAGLIASTVDKLTMKKKKGEGTPTYFAEFENYCDKVEEVARIIENQKNSTLLDIEISKAFVDKFRPYIQRLEAVIAIGIQDKQKFEEEVLEPLRIEFEAEPSNVVAKKQYMVAKQKIELFDDKLARLQETLAIAKNTVAENQLSQAPNMQLVLMYESYNRNTVPALKIQAASMIQTKRQESKINKQQLLVEVTNEAFLKNSQQLKKNIDDVNKLASEGNIKISTLQELKKNIGEAVALVQKGNEQRIKERNRNMELLSEISSDLDGYQDTIRNIMATDVFDYDTVIEATDSVDDGKKKITYVKGS